MPVGLFCVNLEWLSFLSCIYALNSSKLDFRVIIAGQYPATCFIQQPDPALLDAALFMSVKISMTREATRTFVEQKEPCKQSIFFYHISVCPQQMFAPRSRPKDIIS